MLSYLQLCEVLKGVSSMNIEPVSITNLAHHQKREVLSSSVKPDLQSLLLIQLQDKLSNIQHEYQVGDSDLQREITAQAAELRQEMKSESAKVQTQLGDVIQGMSRDMSRIDLRIQQMNKTISTYHRSKNGELFC